VGREVSHRDPPQWQRLLRPESTGDRRSRRAVQEDVRGAKEALSRHPQAEVPMPDPFTDVLVTRGELEGLVRPAMLRSVELLSHTLRNAGITAQSLAGIYLVGGSSRLPLVGSMISEKLGVVPSNLDQPETAVAYGAQQVGSDGSSTRPQAPDGASAPGATQRTPPLGDSGTPTVGSIAPIRPVTPPPGAPGRPGYPPPGPTAPGFAHHATPGVGRPGGAPRPGQGTSENGSRGSRKRKRLLVGTLTAVLLLLLAGSGVFYFTMRSSVTTHTASQCATPGEPGSDGFTGCLRQLAGDIADGDECEPGMGDGPEATRDDLGVTVTCPTPG